MKIISITGFCPKYQHIIRTGSISISLPDLLKIWPDVRDKDISNTIRFDTS